jgi:hypothetical protein
MIFKFGLPRSHRISVNSASFCDHAQAYPRRMSCSSNLESHLWSVLEGVHNGNLSY